MKTISRTLAGLLVMILLIALSGHAAGLSVKDALSGLVLLGCLGFLIAGRPDSDSGHDPGW
ncbi:hypothetical protein [Reinekea blandensis]|uniref:Uncharacterized protein n=1 Tax=Reinekea blandensis MED297 TaxID=314283 RepID=A4BFY4_9GAMM|nr:hypothetical protein [Reinekea blandensis]EAR09002.1 hypothetical protein MED297_03897 [Reinekea sp. MED297] [Reinekea blandensis MED297]